jgi:uncharacterized protein
MTINREEIVTAVVAAAGGTLASRVRLQKSVYLLDRLGLDSGFDYDYYHYGPYSRDLENAAADAQAFEMLVEEFGRRKSDGAMYSVFKTNSQPKKEAFGSLDVKTAENIMQSLAATNVTVLELAATVDWLCHFEKRRDWQSEVRKRKGVKASQDRLEKAIGLLKDLGLEPPASAPA